MYRRYSQGTFCILNPAYIIFKIICSWPSSWDLLKLHNLYSPCYVIFWISLLGPTYVKVHATYVQSCDIDLKWNNSDGRFYLVIGFSTMHSRWEAPMNVPMSVVKLTLILSFLAELTLLSTFTQPPHIVVLSLWLQPMWMCTGRDHWAGLT